MTDAYNKIKQGLENALAQAKGKDIGARIIQEEGPGGDVRKAMTEWLKLTPRVTQKRMIKPRTHLEQKRLTF